MINRVPSTTRTGLARQYLLELIPQAQIRFSKPYIRVPLRNRPPAVPLSSHHSPNPTEPPKINDLAHSLNTKFSWTIQNKIGPPHIYENENLHSITRTRQLSDEHFAHTPSNRRTPQFFNSHLNKLPPPWSTVPPPKPTNAPATAKDAVLATAKLPGTGTRRSKGCSSGTKHTSAAREMQELPQRRRATSRSTRV